MAFESGVTFYTSGTAVITVYFPTDQVKCQWCRFCKNEDSLKRHKCMLTDEYLPFPFTGIGNECPIAFNKEEQK